MHIWKHMLTLGRFHLPKQHRIQIKTWLQYRNRGASVLYRPIWKSLQMMASLKVNSASIFHMMWKIKTFGRKPNWWKRTLLISCLFSSTSLVHTEELLGTGADLQDTNLGQPPQVWSKMAYAHAPFYCFFWLLDGDWRQVDLHDKNLGLSPRV